MHRKKSIINLINPTTICMLICAITLFNLTYKTYEYKVGDPIGAVGGRLLVGISGGVVGAIFGLILSFIVHLFFGPSRTQRLLKEQNRILNDNNNENNYSKNSKVDELNKLNDLKKSGLLSLGEFKKLKNEILNRR